LPLGYRSIHNALRQWSPFPSPDFQSHYFRGAFIVNDDVVSIGPIRTVVLIESNFGAAVVAVHLIDDCIRAGFDTFFENILLVFVIVTATAGHQQHPEWFDRRSRACGRTLGMRRNCAKYEPPGKEKLQSSHGKTLGEMKKEKNSNDLKTKIEVGYDATRQNLFTDFHFHREAAAFFSHE
jgi:hypothetical protein